MLYEIVTIAGKEFKLRLGAQDCADVEKRLGKSVLDVLLAMAPDEMPADGKSETMGNLKGMSTPKVGEVCIIIHGAMQKFQHGTTLDQIYDLYDEHIDKGGSYNDFFDIIYRILEVSGFLPKRAAEVPEAPEPDTAPELSQN
jgi:hypothetical protein